MVSVVVCCCHFRCSSYYLQLVGKQGERFRRIEEAWRIGYPSSIIMTHDDPRIRGPDDFSNPPSFSLTAPHIIIIFEFLFLPLPVIQSCVKRSRDPCPVRLVARFE